MFWTDSSFEPKMDFKWEVSIEAGPGWFIFKKLESFFAKSVDKPSFEINKKQYNLINRKINIPGNPTWNDINMTFVDNAENEVFDFLMTYFYTINVKYDSKNANGLEYISTTEKFTDIAFVVKQYDSEQNVLESWKLYNPVITSYSHSPLSYESDNLSEYNITVSYDWASVENEDVFDEKINKKLYKPVAESVASTLTLPKVYALDESMTAEGEDGELLE